MKKIYNDFLRRALIIDPYLDTLGGGEQHILSFAKVLEDSGCQVFLAYHDPKIAKKLVNILDIKINEENFITNFNQLSTYERYKLTSGFDYLIYATDGSYFFSGAKHNYVFSMYPKRELYRMTLLNRLKLNNFEFISNSPFTKKHIKKWVSRPVHVVTPYLDDLFFKPINKEKQKTIVSVGRFFGHLHSKRQDVLIKSFIKLSQHISEWRLVLIGGLKPEANDYFEKIKNLSKDNKDIKIITNARFEQVLDHLNRASIYWHGAGYGLDEEKNLESVEHFGITPLQGMARGDIVFAYNAGGQRDVIKNGENGFLYNDMDELIKLTLEVINNNNLENRVRINASITAKNYNFNVFKQNCQKIFKL